MIVSVSYLVATSSCFLNDVSVKSLGHMFMTDMHVVFCITVGGWFWRFRGCQVIQVHPPLFQRYPTTRRNPWYFWQHEFFRSLSTLDLQGEFQEILEFASGFGSVWFKYFFCGVYIYIYISRIEVLLLLFDVHIHSPYFSKYGSMIHTIYVYMFIYAPLHISTIVFRARSHSCSCGH